MYNHSAQSAGLEIFHSRPVVPTRRIALGKLDLNSTTVSDKSPLTLGGLLLAVVVARYSSGIHPDLWDDLEILIHRIKNTSHIPQPYLRFRLQTDKVGLAKSFHAMTRKSNGGFDVKFAHHASHGGVHYAGSSSLQQVLGALYATRTLEGEARNVAITAIRVGLSWWGTDDPRLADYILDEMREKSHGDHPPPKSWALKLLDLDTMEPTGAEIQRHFRRKLWSIHPDRGGDPVQAAGLIRELAEARRVLLSAELSANF